MSQLGNKLQALREERGLNIQQLADMLGVTRSAVRHMERGIRKPSFEMLVKLTDVFGVPADEFTRMETETVVETA